MLTVVLVTQLAFNVLLLYSLWRLVEERRVVARTAEDRADRLEALAKEFCSLGSALTRAAATSPAVEAPTSVQEKEQPTTRVEGAVALLERGVSVEGVAEATTMPTGEVEVLNNLRRTGAVGTRRRTPAAAASTPVKTAKNATGRRGGTRATAR